ncbi:MAG: hypothetical protein MZV63_17380 [Marinilabiliales bacterium]|nr:hypothetical protein [Marinilabiliales bacterium]
MRRSLRSTVFLRCRDTKCSRDTRREMPALHFLQISRSSTASIQTISAHPSFRRVISRFSTKCRIMDRMEEIIVGGGIAGIIRYFPSSGAGSRSPPGSLHHLYAQKSVMLSLMTVQSRSSAIRA